MSDKPEDRRTGNGRRSTDADLSERVGEMTDALKATNAKIADLATVSRRRKWTILTLTLSVLLDLALSIGFFVSLSHTNDAQNRTDAVVERLEKLDNTAKAACLAANDSAAKQQTLWQGILALPSTDEPTDPAVAAQFQKLLDETFVQQDCDK